MTHRVCMILPLAISAILVFMPSRSYAQEGAGFALAMDSQTLTGRPGSTVESSLTIVTTNTRETTRYEILAMDLGQLPSGTAYPIEQGAGARSCAGWIRLQESIEIPPDGSATIPFSITIPGDATGGYYAFIRVKNLPRRPEGERVVVMVQPALSVKVELEIPGRTNISLDVKDLQYDRDLADGRPGLMLDVKNEGEMKASLEGDVLLYGPKGTFPYRALIPMDEGGNPHVLFPGLSNRFSCPFLKEPPPGQYRARVRLRMAGRWRTSSDFDITIPPPTATATATATSLGRSEFDIDIDAKPDYVEVALPPGARRTVSIRVQNRDSVEVQAKASVVNVAQELNGFYTYSDITDPTRRWVEASPAEWVLKPRSTKSVLLNITAPEYEEESFAQCAVRIVGQAGTDEAGWLSEADLGIPIIVIPPRSAPPELEISNLEVIRPAPGKNPTSAVLFVRNVGGHTAKVTGQLVLERAASRKQIQAMDIAMTEGLILPPGGSREFRMPVTYLDKDEFRLKAAVSIVDQPRSGKQSEITFTCYQGPES